MTEKPDPAVRAMRTICDDITASIGRGDLPPGAIADLKRVVDDTRLRLWASMEAADTGDPAWVQEFWLQRAADMCHQAAEQLESGAVDPQSDRAAGLRANVHRLADSLGGLPG